MQRVLSSLLVLSLLACGGSSESESGAADAREPVNDEHSLARPDEVRVKHMRLNLEVDFENRVLHGTNGLLFDALEAPGELVLDTHALKIDKVLSWKGQAREWALAEPQGRLGRQLTVQLLKGDMEVTVHYRTTPEGEALQFLEPAMTGGDHPYLFTQGQAILTRSWMPCQDSPGVRVTFDAYVIAPKPLTVLMSAGKRHAPKDLRHDDGVDDTKRVFSFYMEQAIPTYLIAMAIGEIDERAISQRCSIFASPALVEAAAAEFVDVEHMVQAAEGLFGAYRWGRYDILILPPAFPYGGMENPTLTFLTPTVIAGDRSLVSIVAHELAHSWSGNLVTNATWRDFWLNEGFTTYFERRIMEALYGADRANMEMLLDWNSLHASLGELEAYQTVLHVNLAGRHPDDGFSGVPYNKGALFLHRLEEVVGRETLDGWLTTWFDKYAFQSATTADLVAFLKGRLPEGKVDLEDWLEGVGIPNDAPKPTSDALTVVEAEVARLAAGAAPGELTTDGWVTHQWLHFLRSLPEDVSAATLGELDATFAFTASGNAEIRCDWIVRSIQAGYDGVDASLEEFLMSVGRRKFLSPIYKALCLTAEGKQRARKIYAQARPRYHAVATTTLDTIVLAD